MGSRDLTAAALAALTMMACAGPKPTVSEVRLEPGGPPGSYRVHVLVTNHGGDGEAKLEIRLRDPDNGRVVAADRAVDLKRGAPATVVVDVPAPPGSYLPEVEIAYPPR